MTVRVKKYAGSPIAPAILKKINCRFVRLKATFVFTFVRSLGTGTYGTIYHPFQNFSPLLYPKSGERFLSVYQFNGYPFPDLSYLKLPGR